MSRPAPSHRDQPRSSDEDVLGDGPIAALLPLYAAVRARPWAVAGIILLTLIACATWLVQRSPLYEARAQILVTPLMERETSFVGLPIVRTSPGDPIRTVQTAASIASSPETASVAASKVGGLTGQEVRAAVAVAPIEGTNVIEITAAADNPDLAAEVASAYAEGVLEVRRRELEPKVQETIEETQEHLESLVDPTGNTASELRMRLSQLESISDGADPTLSVAQLADVPSSPTGRPDWMLLLIAAAAGTILGVGVSALMRMATPRRIEDELALGEFLDAPVLARITWRSTTLETSERSPNPKGGFRHLRNQLVFRATGSPSGPGSAEGGEVVVLLGVSEGDETSRSAAALAIAIQRAGETASTVSVERRPNQEADPKAMRLRATVSEARKHSDYVIVDMGPTTTIGSSLPILHDVDQVLVVVRLGRTLTTDLLRTSELLLATGTREIAAFPVLDQPRWSRRLRSDRID